MFVFVLALFGSCTYERKENGTEYCTIVHSFFFSKENKNNDNIVSAKYLSKKKKIVSAK